MTAFTTRRLQLRLAELGFDPGPIDGIRGPQTDAAIVAFKKSVGLRARPYVGPITTEALFGPPLESDLPWLDAARAMLGVHERRDHGRLRAWFGKSVSWIDPRDIPWCGAFVATCHRMAAPEIGLPENPLGARNWKDWGFEVGPQLGATLVFWRTHPTKSWHGHVGFYWGEDATHFHVLGGNQSDAVTISRIRRERLLSARWPMGAPYPSEPKIKRLSPSGAPVSEDEA